MHVPLLLCLWRFSFIVVSVSERWTLFPSVFAIHLIQLVIGQVFCVDRFSLPRSWKVGFGYVGCFPNNVHGPCRLLSLLFFCHICCSLTKFDIRFHLGPSECGQALRGASSCRSMHGCFLGEVWTVSGVGVAFVTRRRYGQIVLLVFPLSYSPRRAEIVSALPGCYLACVLILT